MLMFYLQKSDVHQGLVDKGVERRKRDLFDDVGSNEGQRRPT